MRSSLGLGGRAWFGLGLSLLAGCTDWDAYQADTGAQGGAGGASTSTSGTGQASSAGSGGSGGGSATPEPCGVISALADDFTTTDGMGTVWKVTDSAVIGGGEAVIAAVADAPMPLFKFLSSQFYYDLRGAAVSIEVKSVTSPSALQTQTYFKIYHDSLSSLSMAKQGTKLIFMKAINNNFTVIGETPYDAKDHRFWRIREDGGTAYWETSIDGVSWVMQSTSSSSFDASSVRVEFGVGTLTAQTDPGEAHFANMNGGVPKGSWCKASTLHDDFADSVVDQRWARAYFDATCEHSEGGVLTFRMAPGKQGACGYRSGSAFDLTDSTVAVEVPLAPAAALPGGSVAFSVVNEGKTIRRAQFALEGGHLYLRDISGNTTKTLDESLHDPNTQRFLRFREQDGQLFWEASADGQAWNVLAAEPDPFPITALGVELTSFLPKAVTSPFEVRFDNLNNP